MSRVFSSHQVNQILSQLVCKHPACITVLSRKNRTGYCKAHVASYVSPGGQRPKRGRYTVSITIEGPMYDELVWLAQQDNTTLADKIRETLEWGLQTIDEEDRMRANL